MTYLQQANTIGREACLVVELILDYCQHQFGVAPCTASGPTPCFNTRKTTLDPVHYSPAYKSYRFTNAKIRAPDTAFPCLQSVQFAPTVIDPGNGLGIRASVTVELQDFQLNRNDTSDPYFRTRPYYPNAQGTFFGTLLARNPYYQNRMLRVYSGFLVNGVFDIANFDVRTYFIQEISGPDQDYKVRVTAKDVLKLADNKRAQAPQPCNGNLVADMGPADTSFTLQPAGIGDLQYDGQGTCVVGGEVMTFARSADTFTVVRAQRTTTAVKHGAKSAVQQCTTYASKFVTDVLYDLLTNVNYANIPKPFIDKAAWDLEATTWMASCNLTAVICKPTGINTLITEILQQCLCYIWWDERQELIQFRAIRPNRGFETTSLDESNNILAGSTALTDAPDQRISQIFVLFGQQDPTLDPKRTDNYAYQSWDPDFDAESAFEYGEQRVLNITSRWFNEANFAQAQALAFRMLQRYRNNPKMLAFTLDAKDSAVWTGSFVSLTTRVMQDIYGASPPQVMEVLSVKEREPGGQFDYTAVLSVFNKRYGFIGPNTMQSYLLDTAFNHDTYCYISSNNPVPQMSNGDSAYYII